MKKLLVLIILCTSVAQAHFIGNIANKVKFVTGSIFAASDTIVENTPNCIQSHPVIPLLAAGLTLKSPLGKMFFGTITNNPIASGCGLLAALYTLNNRKTTITPTTVPALNYFGKEIPVVSKASSNQIVASAALGLTASVLMYAAGSAGLKALFNHYSSRPF